MTTKHLKMLESEENMEDKSKKYFNAIENALAGPAGFVASLRSPTTPGVGSKNPKQDLGFLLTSYGVRTYGSRSANR